jgi:hypothetical protein
VKIFQNEKVSKEHQDNEASTFDSQALKGRGKRESTH